jgi:hypothetical protein
MDAATFWSAVGAIGTCVAAIAAVITLRPRTKKFVRLQGRWKGDLGDEREFVIDLRIEKGQIEGRIHWKLVECPPSLPWASQVGTVGIEMVEGKLERGVLTFGGTKVLGPDPDLVSLSNYTIPLPANGNLFEGRSEPQKKRLKQVRGRRRTERNRRLPAQTTGSHRGVGRCRSPCIYRGPESRTIGRTRRERVSAWPGPGSQRCFA